MIKKELPVFLLVGCLTVVVDFLTYRALLVWSPLPLGAAKGIAFVAGTVFAYIANQFWTFNHVESSKGSWWRFILLYSMTLGANVIINSVTLAHMTPNPHAVQVAFVIATGVSAALNFIGMKFFVFRTPFRGKFK